MLRDERGTKVKKNLAILLLIVTVLLSLPACGDTETGKLQTPEQAVSAIEEDGEYSQAEEIAEYIYLYQRLPRNFISKKEAISLGWKGQEGNLWEVTEQMSIGGDFFGNREGFLPRAEGRQWYECDVNYQGGFRGKERLVYSNDGLFYYTDDHYQTFTEITLAAEEK
jgi:ribonuclease T1